MKPNLICWGEISSHLSGWKDCQTGRKMERKNGSHNCSRVHEGPPGQFMHAINPGCLRDWRWNLAFIYSEKISSYLTSFHYFFFFFLFLFILLLLKLIWLIMGDYCLIPNDYVRGARMHVDNLCKIVRLRDWLLNLFQLYRLVW
jgi:hypothetical protein